MQVKEEELYSVIEALNLEIIELKKSKEYSLGKNFKELIYLLKKKEVGEIFERCKKKKKLKYIKNNLNSHEEMYNEEIERYSKIEYDELKGKKIAIYTCIIGDYDKLRDPLITNKNIDYFLFTDNENIKSNIWKVRTIPKEILNLKNNTLINRYIKLNPHKFFNNYDYSMYIDGNVTIVSDIYGMIYKSNSSTGLAMHKHVTRDCLYLEAETCILLKKGKEKEIKAQINRYKEEGMPKEFGLLEATIIVTNIKNTNSKNILEKWWEELYKSKSLRDQISLPYVLWSNQYSLQNIGILGNNIYKNPKVRIDSH